MKRTILSLLFIVLHSSLMAAQLTQTEKLASAGKIYGFLKYYHPVVASGKFNWDQELLKYLPKIKQASSKQDLSKIYLDWIKDLGPINVCKKCKNRTNSFDKNFDLSWIQDEKLFSLELSDKLQYIEQNRFQGTNHYVRAESIGKIKVTNEPSYENIDYPDENLRLLGLFKYWNVIEYFYPYKYLTDQAWDNVLLEMIPKFQKAANKDEYQLTIKELITKLDDTHAWISFEQNRLKHLPIKVKQIENQAVVVGFYNDSLAALNNLKTGDIILKINELDINKEAEKKLKFVSGSNSRIKIREAYREVLTGTESLIKLTIKRGNEIQEIQVKRYGFQEFNYYNNPKIVKSKVIGDDIGYINMAVIKKADVPALFDDLGDKKAIIIDLRNYPAFLYWHFSNYLNSEKRDFAKMYSPDLSYPGKFFTKNNLQTGRKTRKAYKGKVILLVNDESISRSEFTIMAFQTADQVITVGNQTASADGDVVVFDYLGTYKTAMSGNGVLYPDGSETQRKGIKIDVVIHPTIKGLQQGRDEVLEKAIELASQ